MIPSEKLNFNDLPEAVLLIINKLSCIEKLLQEKQDKLIPDKKYLTVDGLRSYIEGKTGKQPARQTVYGWIFRNQIPNIKRGKAVLFETASVDLWLVENKRQSISEIRKEIG